LPQNQELVGAIHSHRKAMLNLCKKYPYYLENLPIELRDDYEFVEDLILSRPAALEYASENLQNNPRLKRIQMKSQISTTNKKNNPTTLNANDTRCFIATSVYGSVNHPKVIDFRNYRDTVLMQNKFGRILVKIYYFLSPKFVYLNERVPLLKKGARHLLNFIHKKIS